MTATMLAPPEQAPGTATTRPGRNWEPLAVTGLLIGTLIAYVWGLGAAGWANSFYSAAAQAGSVSWKAMLFGSSDAANSITVDKPPASLWLMDISVRIFGLNSWSILVPQALLGVASVALLYRTVRRCAGPAAGLLAGLGLAITPVAVLMFRFNNPDALLVLLMIAAVWAVLRAVEDGRTRWLVLTGVFVGLGFLTKQLAVMLIVPPLALTYLIAGPPKLGKRVAQLFAALGGLIAGAGWWVLIAELWPADSRPWIGGSQHNSILELTLGYNGLGRINGNETGSVIPGMGGEGAPTPGAGMWGTPGWDRLFQPAQAGQIAWLLPTALALLLIGLWLRGRAPRTDLARASLIVWGGWLVVTGLTFSLMQGIFHPYYTVALAPAIAAIVGIGATLLWRERAELGARLYLAATFIVTGATAWILLNRTPDYTPWMRWAVAAATVVAVLGVLLAGRLRAAGVVTVLAALFAAVGGQAAYAGETIAHPRGGAIVSAGPSAGFGFGGMGHGPRFGPEGFGPRVGDGAVVPGERMGFPGGMFGEHRGGPGGMFGGGAPSAQITALLAADAARYTWAAATVSSTSAASYQLATQLPVMAIGGFNGTDPSPTLEEFQQYVADGKVHYFIASRGGFGPGADASTPANQITTWVAAHYPATTVDGVTMYDLSAPAH